MSIRNHATLLLEQTKLLRHLGSAHIVGSYVTDLMVYNDLDFYMNRDSLSEKAYYALAADLMQLLKPIRYDGFIDMEKKIAFIGMETAISGERWNIDIWWKTAEAIQAAETEAQQIISRTAAQPELKEAILTIKQGLCDRRLYGLDKRKKHYHSQEIYDSVFLEGIRSVEEFLQKHSM